MHVLIIEDEAMVALMIEDLLRDLGYTSFAFAATEAEAVAAASVRRPSLITSDVRLLEGCGISAVQEIWSNQIIPVIFITASAGEVHVRAPSALVVGKPFTFAGLANALIGIRAR